MTLSAFPDINVWLALAYDEHFHHREATQWFQNLDDSSNLFFCRHTQMGLLRLLTTASVMKSNVKTQARAWETYDSLTNDDRVGFLYEAGDTGSRFRELSAGTRASPKDWADSYLAAMSLCSRVTLVTFDRALAVRVDGSILLDVTRH